MSLNVARLAAATPGDLAWRPPDGQALPDRGMSDAPTKKASEDVSTLSRCNRSMTGAFA
jgi:hypothetical protein